MVIDLMNDFSNRSVGMSSVVFTASIFDLSACIENKFLEFDQIISILLAQSLLFLKSDQNTLRHFISFVQWNS